MFVSEGSEGVKTATLSFKLNHPGPSDSETPRPPWSGAMDGSCSDDSEIEEEQPQERAGGGPGPTGRGPEQEDRGRIRADDVYLEYWRSILSDRILWM